jgi:hypothetical protein
MLNKTDVVQYVGTHAPEYGLDGAAVLAVAEGEGLKTTPGSHWTVPGENYPSLGPPSWYTGASDGAFIVQQQGSVEKAAQWSWTPSGLDYWLQKVATESKAQGLTGSAAISRIVTNFERPAARYVQGNINNAIGVYDSYKKQIAGGPGGNTIVPVPPESGLPFPIPGQTQPGQLPTPSNPQAKDQTQTSAKFSLHLFDTPAGPWNITLPWDFSGILLFLAAIFAIIIGAILWKPSRDAGTNVAMMAAA